MPVINRKNILALSELKRRVIWNQIRDEPGLQLRLGAAELIGMIPGAKPIGGLVAHFLRFSVSARGVVECLIGDDPAEIEPAPLHPEI